jgi:hypothetical protein
LSRPQYHTVVTQSEQFAITITDYDLKSIARISIKVSHYGRASEDMCTIKYLAGQRIVTLQFGIMRKTGL